MGHQPRVRADVPMARDKEVPENDGGASGGHPDDKSANKNDWGTS